MIDGVLIFDGESFGRLEAALKPAKLFTNYAVKGEGRNAKGKAFDELREIAQKQGAQVARIYKYFLSLDGRRYCAEAELYCLK